MSIDNPPACRHFSTMEPMDDDQLVGLQTYRHVRDGVYVEAVPGTHKAGDKLVWVYQRAIQRLGKSVIVRRFARQPLAGEQYVAPTARERSPRGRGRHNGSRNGSSRSPDDPSSPSDDKLALLARELVGWARDLRATARCLLDAFGVRRGPWDRIEACIEIADRQARDEEA